MKPVCVFESQDVLGEGPVWDPEDQALYWVDIKERHLQKWTPATGDYRVWALPEEIGSFALRTSGGAVLALQTGFHALDFESGDVIPLFDPEADMPGNRFNDGKCDRAGRFWAGTMDNAEVEIKGALYRFDPDHSCRLVRPGAFISNGLGWSPDNRTMYYADSGKGNIYAFDFDLPSGAIAYERVFAALEQGSPDGLTVDAEGYLWNAVWDGWRVVRYAPDGTIDQEIRMPVQRPTSLSFGGPDLDVLYVTSASINLPPETRQVQPLAGGVFAIYAGVRGLPEPRFRG
jgi:sugar lactone lactonase YvrE